MRISGGTAKGRRTAAHRLLAGKSAGERLRPTSSKVREALFDILRKRIEGSRFLDLFAGTGTVGLEALSRGAGKAFFVEPDETRIRAIRKIVGELGFQRRAVVVKGRAHAFLMKMSAEHERFDILFLDPPYHSEELEKILPVIGNEGLLHEGGVVVVEHFFKREMPEEAGHLRRERSYRYGDTVLTLYKRNGT